MITTNYSQANVTISGGITTTGTLPTPNSNQTIFTTVTTGTGANQTVRSVTAGKTYYLMGLTISGASVTCDIKDNGDTRVTYVNTGAADSSKTISFACPIVYTSGQNVRASITNGQSVQFYGVEQ